MSLSESATNHELYFVLAAVLGIILLQILLIIALLAYRDYAAKAKWRRWSQRGVVFVNGPAVYWADDLPMPSVPVHFDATVSSGQPQGRAVSNLQIHVDLLHNNQNLFEKNEQA